ncbi:unannotated protein [freshwater metagenome]|uniref:Unannotated protein n=1 Tax=freshwater metagenome TaxID=449393 RepID=A0A6J7XNG7_9ZZZZ|nr:hypothetical protein [Actinomycetota bacterium]
MKNINELADEYESATSYFAKLVEGVAPTQLDIKAPGQWSARQVIHHMADSEAQSYARLRRLLAEPEGSLIQGYDESAWAQAQILGYDELPVANSLAVLLSVRAASLDLIRRMKPSDLDKFGLHSERGKFTISQWLDAYSDHPRDHGAQLERALQGLP